MNRKRKYTPLEKDVIRIMISYEKPITPARIMARTKRTKDPERLGNLLRNFSDHKLADMNGEGEYMINHNFFNITDTTIPL